MTKNGKVKPLDKYIIDAYGVVMRDTKENRVIARDIIKNGF